MTLRIVAIDFPFKKILFQNIFASKNFGRYLNCIVLEVVICSKKRPNVRQVSFLKENKEVMGE